MKLFITPYDTQPSTGILELLETKSDAKESLVVPIRDIHCWYPFHSGYEYRYSPTTNLFYLTPDTRLTKPQGEVYNSNEPTFSKTMTYDEHTLVNHMVKTRNEYIIERADKFCIPHILTNYTKTDVKKAFQLIGNRIDTVKQLVKERYEDTEERPKSRNKFSADQIDQDVFTYMAEDEQNLLTEFGEMYGMVRLMDRLVQNKGR